MKTETIEFDYLITKEQETTYFPLSFQVPEHVESLTVTYTYPRYHTIEQPDGSVVKKTINIIDFALMGPNNSYLGSSGSNRSSITICEYGSSQGFMSFDTIQGEWKIIVGAYQVLPEGVSVHYHVSFQLKELRLYKGDTHLHTTASDGNLTARELVEYGKQLNLDYMIITDHNSYSQNFEPLHLDGLTIIPGAEWTHYKGHIGMLGVKKPFETAFCVNSVEEAKAKVAEAKANGALIVLNHPFCPYCGFSFGIKGFQYDMVEIWNGGVMPATINIGLLWWDAELRNGRRISVIGGSDFHQSELLHMPASPCTNLYAKSRTQTDLLKALAKGNSYITRSPKGPDLSVDANGHILGEAVPIGTEVSLRFWNLTTNDRILLITEKKTEELVCSGEVTELNFKRTPINTKFFRIEVYRRPYPGAAEEISMISNPIYFDA